MKTSSDHILTSHVGSLPRPDDLIAANRAREAGEATTSTPFGRNCESAVAEVVRRQRELGIDVPGDGEFGKSVGTASTTAHGGAIVSIVWVGSSSTGRSWILGRRGVAPRGDRADQRRRSAGPRTVRCGLCRPQVGYYDGTAPATGPVCVGPLTYTGHAAIDADIANFKAALRLPASRKDL